MERIETTAIRNLIHNEEYCRKVLPFIKEEYFTDRLEKLIFTEIYKFVNNTCKRTVNEFKSCKVLSGFLYKNIIIIVFWICGLMCRRYLRYLELLQCGLRT